MLRRLITSIGLFAILALGVPAAYAAPHSQAPVPLLKKGAPVKWWFVFKFNAKAFPACGGTAVSCPFGGTVANKTSGQQYVYASNKNPALQKGGGCVGDATTDPVGATFDEVYNGPFYYVLWNDQPYGDPRIPACGKNCDSPWGHSKGLLAWNAQGSGLVMQVSTPDWPEAGSSKHPRKTDGNSLGCIAEDNDIKVSQHFFALKLTKDDVVKVLNGLSNASIATDPFNPQIVNNGGPSDIQALVQGLGKKSKSEDVLEERLSSGVTMVSKPSRLHVPPWQMLSSVLGGVPLRAATWWASPKIGATNSTSNITCWDGKLKPPGPVEIALTGKWDGHVFSLEGGPGTDRNHAKIGVSAGNGSHHYAIFSDLNQQGSLSGNCLSSQNGRGGLFYVLDDAALSRGVGSLISDHIQ